MPLPQLGVFQSKKQWSPEPGPLRCGLVQVALMAQPGCHRPEFLELAPICLDQGRQYLFVLIDLSNPKTI